MFSKKGLLAGTAITAGLALSAGAALAQAVPVATSNAAASGGQDQGGQDQGIRGRNVQPRPPVTPTIDRPAATPGAPTGTPAGAPAGASTGANEDVVVTAQRRSERLQDVPASVTSLSSAVLAKSGVTNTSDLAKLTTAVAIPFYGAFLQPSIRGVSSTGANIGDSSNVALYLDGVYQPQQIASLIDLPDVREVEILKGPQGALYGQNATGGAILVNTRTPDFTPGGMLTQSYGNYDDVRTTGYVTGPISRQVAASLSGGYENRNGFRTEVATGGHDRGLDSRVIRGKVLAEATDNLEFLLTGYYTDRTDSSAYAGVPLNNNSVGYAFFPDAPKVSSPNQFATDPNVYARIKAYGGVLKSKLSLEHGTFNSLTSYSQTRTSFDADLDYGPVNYAVAPETRLDAHYFQEDANFTSNRIGRFTFMLGAFFLEGTETFNPSSFQLEDPTVLPSPDGAVTYSLPQYGRLAKQVRAGYGEITMDITRKLSLTVDGRYTSERQRGYSDITALGTVGPIVQYPGGAVTFNKFTPRVVLRYKLTTDSMIYASWGEGFKSGIINTTNLAQAPVRPETISAFEVGLKARLLRNLRFNVAAFDYDYTNLQVVAYAPPAYIQQNAASARIKGAETDLGWTPLHGLTLSGGAAYLDAHYASFPDAQVFVPTGFGNLAETADLSGHTLLRSPRWTANLSADYATDIRYGHLDAYAAAAFNSGYGFEVSNRIYQPDYTTIDAQLSFEPARLRSMRFVLWGRNLTNRAYLSSVLVSPFADGAAYADPRTYGGRLEYRF